MPHSPTRHELVLKRIQAPHSNDQYAVYFGELYVGRIFNRIPGANAAAVATWFWGIDSNALHLAPTVSGSASTRDEAMIAFREAWDRGPNKDGFKT